MKLKEFIKQLETVKDELQDKDVFIIAKNGIMISPEIKFSLRNYDLLDKTKKNVEFILIN